VETRARRTRLLGRRAVVRGVVGLPALALLGARTASARRRPASADFVIVGGGVYGVGLAWELGRRGARVVVLEAARVADGASGGIGMRGVRSNGREPGQLRLMPQAQARWAELALMLGDRRIFRRTGHLELIESESDLPAAASRVSRQAAHGVVTRLVEREELHRIEPHLSDRVIAAVHCPDDGVSDHSVTTRALARAARREGVRIVTGARVVGIELTGGRAAGVTVADGERIGVDRELVLTANGGTAELLEPAFGLRLPLFDVFPQALATDRITPVPVRHLIGHASRRLAMKALPGRRVMITGGWLGRLDPRTGRGETIESEIAGNLAEAVAVYPTLAGARIARAVADRVESILPDLLPVVDRPPGVANVLLAAGWSGQGWAPAPIYVELIAEWLLGGARPELLAPFSLARFRAPAP